MVQLLADGQIPPSYLPTLDPPAQSDLFPSSNQTFGQCSVGTFSFSICYKNYHFSHNFVSQI